MTEYCCEKCGEKFCNKSLYDIHLLHNNSNLDTNLLSDYDKLILESEKKIKTKNEENIKVISLFTGMGGMDIGFGEDVIVHKNSISEINFIKKKYEIENFVILKKLPFEIVFQNDILPIAEKIIKLNKWNHNFILKDIKDLIKEDYKFPDADIIIGGFPCQDFSHAGKRKGFDSERGNLYKSYVDIVKKIKPIIFVAENVYGLITMKENPIDIIKNDFKKEGYEVKHQLIKCEEYGIPQTRWRVIIMGICNDKLNNVQKIKGEEWNVISKNKTKCFINKYFDHLKEPENTQDISQQIFSKAKKLEKGQGQTEIKLNNFCPTIRAEHHGNIEFRRLKDSKNEENNINLKERRLTLREVALAQTFPPKCILTDKKKSMSSYKTIGNAVPCLLSYLIADKVYELYNICK